MLFSGFSSPLTMYYCNIEYLKFVSTVNRTTFRKISKFGAKMHQIRFQLGLRPRPRCENLQRFSRPSSCI